MGSEVAVRVGTVIVAVGNVFVAGGFCSFLARGIFILFIHKTPLYCAHL